MGIDQARRAADCLARLRPVRVWSSDLARARQTAEFLGERVGLPVVGDPRLREVDVGVRSGLNHQEFSRTYPERFRAWQAGADEHLVTGEESQVAVRERVLPALEEMRASLGEEQTGVVVSHGS